MNEEGFWRMIGEAKDQAANQPPARIGILKDKLSELSPEEIL